MTVDPMQVVADAIRQQRERREADYDKAAGGAAFVIDPDIFDHLDAEVVVAALKANPEALAALLDATPSVHKYPVGSSAAEADPVSEYLYELPESGRG
jgi:hypothetical protein